jgi:hypothetical protein
MPTYRGHYYDVRPRRPGWSWSAFELDGVTPLGRGDADTKRDAETAAMSAIDNQPEAGDEADHTT